MLLCDFLGRLLQLELFRVLLDILLRLVQVIRGLVRDRTLCVDHHFGLALMMLLGREEGVVRGSGCVGRGRVAETYFGFHALAVTKHYVSLLVD